MDSDSQCVRFGREVCGEFDAALRREWLVTNGLGGFASGTVAGIATRRYHGLLVAALTPCVGRMVLVGGAVEEATYAGHRYALSAHEYADGTIDPHGYRLLEGFALDGTIPVWTYRLADALLERRLWMRHGGNTTFVQYRLDRAGSPLNLRVQPLLACRDFHALGSDPGIRPRLQALDRGVAVTQFDGATPTFLRSSAGNFDAQPLWYWNFLHREERARGLDDHSNLFVPGAFEVTLVPGQTVTLIFSADTAAVSAGDEELRSEQDRQARLLALAGTAHAAPAVRQLVLAADQFVVDRWLPRASTPVAAGSSACPLAPSVPETGKSIIAGYHWFTTGAATR